MAQGEVARSICKQGKKEIELGLKTDSMGGRVTMCKWEGTNG